MDTVTTLFRKHAQLVQRALRRAGVAERDVSDATQEVFVVVHRRLHEFEGRASVTTWLYRIAWRVASETRRRAFRRHERLSANGEDADAGACEEPAPRADDLLERRHMLCALLDAVERLDHDKREALVLHELEERPMRDVAAELRIPLKTAFSRVYAARRELLVDLRKGGFACNVWWLFGSHRIQDWNWKVTSAAPSAASMTAPSLGSWLLAALLVLPAGANMPVISLSDTVLASTESRTELAAAVAETADALDVQEPLQSPQVALRPRLLSPLAIPDRVLPQRHPHAQLVIAGRHVR